MTDFTIILPVDIGTTTDTDNSIQLNKFYTNPLYIDIFCTATRINSLTVENIKMRETIYPRHLSLSYNYLKR